MKDEIQNAYSDANVEIIAGSGGNFIVDVDGNIIFSKAQMNRPRFPEVGEINSLISKLKA